MLIHSTLNTLDKDIIPKSPFDKRLVVEPENGVTIDILRRLGTTCGSSYDNFQNIHSSMLIYPIAKLTGKEDVDVFDVSLIGIWLMTKDADRYDPASFVVCLDISGPTIKRSIVQVLEIAFINNRIHIPYSPLDDNFKAPLLILDPSRSNFYALVADFVRYCGSRSLCGTYKVRLSKNDSEAVNLARVWNTGDIYGVGGVHPLPAWIETELGIGD